MGSNALRDTLGNHILTGAQTTVTKSTTGHTHTHY